MKQYPSPGPGISAESSEILKAAYLGEVNVMNLLPSGVCVCDASGLIINYNKKAAELWGRIPASGERHDRYCGALKMYHADGRYMPPGDNPVAACLADGQARNDVEIIFERPDMSRVFVRANVLCIKDEQGNTMGAINSFYEITDPMQKKTGQVFKLNEWQDYADNAIIALHWVDANGVIKWANKAELEMLGYTEQEYIGHHISEFHTDKEKIDDILRRLSCKETLNGYESVLRCKDGSTRTVNIHSNVLWEDGVFVHTRCFTMDVTAQKKLFQALTESEGRNKALLNSMPTGVYTCNKEGKITFFNEVAVQLWGYKPDIDDDNLKYCACFKLRRLDGTLIPPDKTPMATVLQSGKPLRNIEAQAERPDGSKFYAIINIDPVLDEKNNVIGAVNNFQDTTELKYAEMALRQSESRYRQLVDNLKAPIFTTDAEGRITQYNQAAADLWGREPELGKDLWCGSYKIFNADGSHLPLELCPMAITLKEGRPDLGREIIIVRPDGSLRNVAPHPQPIFDETGKLIGAVNMLVDLTDVKRSESALRESEKNYRLLTTSLERQVEEQISDLKKKNEELTKSEERYHKMIDEVEDYAIILLDKDGIIQNWNKGAEKIKGYKENEIVGKNFGIFYREADRKSGLDQNLIGQARETGKAIHEGWRVRKNGSVFWGSIVLTSLHDETGNVLGFSKVTRDLTERKFAEDKIKDYLSELEFQNKELQQFVYAASHDIKEPLRKIHFYNSVISERASHQLDEKSKVYLTRSISAVKRMSDLIENLLTYSKSTSNIESFEDVDLTEVVEEIVLIHTDEFDQKKVIIEAGELPLIRGVPFQLKQLMDNLVNNSIKYKHPSRDVNIKITSSLVKGIEITDREAESGKLYHKISVIDNGIGFEPQYSEKIFEIFQRLNSLPEKKGSGIGLAICKKIVQNHRGFIRGIGKVNEGSRFDLYFPSAE